MFNPRPEIQVLPIAPGQACYVVDDALLDPERLRLEAIAQRGRFAMAPHNAYPGLELRMPEAFSQRLDDFFRLHVRARLGMRRTLRMYSRLALATLRPDELQPRQCICHRDRLGFAPGQRVAASVLYLFDDPALGGTSFYRPLLPPAEMAPLFEDAGTLGAEAFCAKHGVARGYMAGGNDWFEPLLSVPAKWNRLIFYDGALFHSGDIHHPERLDPDPARGRLTLNGFFTCSPARAA
ncbi:MAG TPA: DUF6445 family protein [Luteimonas sp.]|nr:DUF6445 family protein [Luteimonas sp.]